VAALTWVAQQPRQGAANSRADEEADQLADVAAAYANRCEHVLGSSDQIPGGTNGASRGAVGGRSVEYGSQADDGFDLMQVKVKGSGAVSLTCYGVKGSYNAREITKSFKRILYGRSVSVQYNSIRLFYDRAPTQPAWYNSSTA